MTSETLTARSEDTWFDLTGLLPPLRYEVAGQILGPQQSHSSESHTYMPFLVTESQFNTAIRPRLGGQLPAEMVKFICDRVSETFRIRRTLKKIKSQIVDIVGEGNFSALWMDREAFSSDSMEHRALVTEAVIHVYDGPALGKIVSLLYSQNIPMIPYGEGGGYNMGVTPMAPAVTVSVRGIDHISEIRPSRRDSNKFEITVGAGLPFKDLQEYLHKRGFVLRCDPNTPRASTGGIVATGSNGGRKIFEVVLEGRAVAARGAALRFALDDHESSCINEEPFLMANKFFSVSDAGAFAKQAGRLLAKGHSSAILPGCREVSIPLRGMKAGANMNAQRHQNLKKSLESYQQNISSDPLQQETTLPISSFVGAEGCTGFVYEVTLEIDRPKPWIQGVRVHFDSMQAAMAFTQAIKGFGVAEQPEFFEIITGPSIRRFLIQDFPSVFHITDEAVLFLGIEGDNETEITNKVALLLKRATEESSQKDSIESALRNVFLTNPEHQPSGRPEFEALIRPREALPKKLRTKCKTDMEIRTEYLADVLALVTSTNLKPGSTIKKEDVMFGHLTPRKTAIIHWNIGGFDLYNEESAHEAWSYLEDVIGKAQKLAPPSDPRASASFSGEHGIAGKAAFLWLNHIEPEDFARMCRVKDALDPKGLFNPETLFLRTSVSRALRARLIAFGTEQVKGLLQTSGHKNETGVAVGLAQDPEVLGALDFAQGEAQRCTRCNSCKICPVIDAEHELRRENPKGYKDSVLPNKRNLVMFLEWVGALKKSAGANVLDPNQDRAITKMFQEASRLLSKCFYCRKCDKACPVDINIHPMVEAFQKIGKVKSGSPFFVRHLFEFLCERLMGDDFFKDWTYKFMAVGTRLANPLFVLLRRTRSIPDWLKTYLSPPQFALAAYEPTQHGRKGNTHDNFVLIGPSASESYVAQAKKETLHVYVRYRGCMDTYSNPAASVAVDTYFKEHLGACFVDLEKKMCCGFPFEADGLKERAERSRFVSMTEIARCIAQVAERSRARATEPGQILFTVFSNCPTCTEAIKEMKELLGRPETRERIRIAAKLPLDFQWGHLEFEVKDTAELAVELLERLTAGSLTGAIPQDVLKKNSLKSPEKILKSVGLKVPCHNTTQATDAQVKLLKMYYTGVSAYDRCCGLSGTGRFKHPKIGTKISEKLFEQIREAAPQAVVSGCPSCRDGVAIQRNLLAGKNDPVADFQISGIFEQILLDQPRG